MSRPPRPFGFHYLPVESGGRIIAALDLDILGDLLRLEVEMKNHRFRAWISSYLKSLKFLDSVMHDFCIWVEERGDFDSMDFAEFCRACWLPTAGRRCPNVRERVLYGKIYWAFHISATLEYGETRELGRIVDRHFPRLERLRVIDARDDRGPLFRDASAILVGARSECLINVEFFGDTRALTDRGLAELSRVTPSLKGFTLAELNRRSANDDDEGCTDPGVAHIVRKCACNLEFVHLQSSEITNLSMKLVLESCPVLHTFRFFACCR
eukprot:gene8385-9964_t